MFSVPLVATLFCKLQTPAAHISRKIKWCVNAHRSKKANPFCPVQIRFHLKWHNLLFPVGLTWQFYLPLWLWRKTYTFPTWFSLYHKGFGRRQFGWDPEGGGVRRMFLPRRLGEKRLQKISFIDRAMTRQISTNNFSFSFSILIFPPNFSFFFQWKKISFFFSWPRPRSILFRATS